MIKILKSSTYKALKIDLEVALSSRSWYMAELRGERSTVTILQRELAAVRAELVALKATAKPAEDTFARARRERLEEAQRVADRDAKMRATSVSTSGYVAPAQRSSDDVTDHTLPVIMPLMLMTSAAQAAEAPPPAPTYCPPAAAPSYEAPSCSASDYSSSSSSYDSGSSSSSSSD